MTDGKLINHSNGIVVIKHIVAHTIDRAVHMHACTRSVLFCQSSWSDMSHWPGAKLSYGWV